MRRKDGVVAAAIAALCVAGLPAAAHAQDEPAGRGLLGGVVTGTTSTLDGALQSVSSATGGAVTLPSTVDVTTTVTGAATGTVQVVAGTVEQITEPVVGALKGPQAAVSLPGLATVDGKTVLDLVVGNVGTEACAPVATVAITGADGVKIAAGATDLLSIGAGASREYALPWPADLAAGTYDIATAVTGCGTLQSIGVSVKVNGSPQPETRSAPGAGAGGTGGTSGTGGNASGGGSGSANATSAGGGSEKAASGSASGSSNVAQSGAGSPGTAPSSTVPAGDATSGGDAAAEQGVGSSRAARAQGRSAGGARRTAGPPAPAALLTTPEAQSQKLVGARGAVGGAPIGPKRATLVETASAVAKALPAVIERAAPALAILGLIGALFLLQEAMARRDPKLALAPVGPADDLEFTEAANFLGRVAKPPAPRIDA